MKEHIKITNLDYERLYSLVQSKKNCTSYEQKNIDVLNKEINKAIRIKSKLIPPFYVTMNSVMVINDLDLNRSMKVKLVYPGNADFNKGYISVLSPLGTALLGSTEGSKITFKVPGGLKNIQIDKILYQPEAQGEFAI